MYKQEDLEKVERKARDKFQRLTTAWDGYPSTVAEWLYFSREIRDLGTLLDDREKILDARTEVAVTPTSMFRFKTSRGAPGVALVEVDGTRVGSVRRFAGGRWCAKYDDQHEYPEKTFRTRGEAAEWLARRSER